jgi:hypothetical protein
MADRRHALHAQAIRIITIGLTRSDIEHLIASCDAPIPPWRIRRNATPPNPGHRNGLRHSPAHRPSHIAKNDRSRAIAGTATAEIPAASTPSDVSSDDLKVEINVVVSTDCLKECAGRFDGGLCAPTVGQVESVTHCGDFQVMDRRGGYRL